MEHEFRALVREPTSPSSGSVSSMTTGSRRKTAHHRTADHAERCPHPAEYSAPRRRLRLHLGVETPPGEDAVFAGSTRRRRMSRARTRSPPRRRRSRRCARGRRPARPYAPEIDESLARRLHQPRPRNRGSRDVRPARRPRRRPHLGGFDGAAAERFASTPGVDAIFVSCTASGSPRRSRDLSNAPALPSPRATTRWRRIVCGSARVDDVVPAAGRLYELTCRSSA